MSVESIALGTVFNFDNWAKYNWCCELNYPGLTEEKDVVYSQSNPDVLKCDLYYNKDSKKYKKYPVLMNIHGGGWIIGDKKNSKGFSMQVADSGVFVMNINYGLPKKEVGMFEKNDPALNHSDNYLFPYPIQTHFEALKWLEDNAKTYNLDLNNVFVSGDSAGAHMAAVVAAANSNQEYADGLGVTQTKIKLKGAMIYCGIYDVDKFNGLPMDKVPIARAMMREFLGTDDVKKSPYYKYLNPIPYMTAEMPKTLIVSGMLDVMTTGQSTKVEKKLQSLGVPCEHYKGKAIPNSFHDFLLLAFTNEARKCMRYTTNWIEETVKG